MMKTACKTLHGKELDMKSRFNHKDHIDPKEKRFLLGLCALCALCGKIVSVFAGGQSGRGAADKMLTCLATPSRFFGQLLRDANKSNNMRL